MKTGSIFRNLLVSASSLEQLNQIQPSLVCSTLGHRGTKHMHPPPPLTPRAPPLTPPQAQGMGQNNLRKGTFFKNLFSQCGNDQLYAFYQSCEFMTPPPRPHLGGAILGVGPKREKRSIFKNLLVSALSLE